MSPEMIMPVAIFSLPWFLAVAELRRGLRRGEMREYLRSDYSECGHDRPSKYCRRDEEPKTFWCLFTFYLLVAILFPIGLVCALTHASETSAPNPGPSPTAESIDG